MKKCSAEKLTAAATAVMRKYTHTLTYFRLPFSLSGPISSNCFFSFRVEKTVVNSISREKNKWDERKEIRRD